MNEKKTINRRQALKTLAAVTGAVSLASLPAWEKPVIEVGALPAHAQSSMATIRVTNVDQNSIPVSIYQLQSGAGTTVQLSLGTLIAGPVTIPAGQTHDFTVPPISPITTLGVESDVTYCDNGYITYSDCTTPGAQGIRSVCLAAGEIWETTVSCAN